MFENDLMIVVVKLVMKLLSIRPHRVWCIDSSKNVENKFCSSSITQTDR
jgi:hypothetical protein